MFKRVLLEDWHALVPYLCFGLIAGAFLIIVIRAFLIKKGDIEHLSSLPLEDHQQDEHE